MTGIGLVGLGAMGWVVAERLDQSGFNLVVHSNSREETTRAAHRGWLVADKPGEVASAQRSVVLCVSGTSATQSVVFDSGGLGPAITANHLIVDIGTTSPVVTMDIAGRLADHVGSQVWIDAPVSGGPNAAAEGRLAMFVGGQLDSVRRATTLLKVLSRDPRHVGGVGTGQWMKVVNQILVLNGVAVLAEAVSMAHAVGIDSTTLPSALAGGYGDSRLLRELTAAMSDGSGPAPSGQFRIGSKDLEMILELARQVGSPLPMSNTAHGLYRRGIELGLGNLAITSIIDVLASLPTGDTPVDTDGVCRVTPLSEGQEE